MTELRQNARLIHSDNAKPKGKGAYKIENDDILILNGSYAGFWVKAMWLQGPDERDYIIRNIYKKGDPEAVRIIKSLFCK